MRFGFDFNAYAGREGVLSRKERGEGGGRKRDKEKAAWTTQGWIESRRDGGREGWRKKEKTF